MLLLDADAPSKRKTQFLRNIVGGVMDKRDQARELGSKGKALLRGSDGVGSAPSISSRGGVQRKGDDARRRITHPLGDRVLKDGDNQ